jgi:hypothetical protein
MGAGKQTVFLLQETSGDLVKTTKLECTHLMHANLVLFTRARAGRNLDAAWLYGGWHKAGIRLENPARPESELSL